MLIAENISYSVGGKKLVDNCSLAIRPGVFTAIVGPNGAGKTSLLKLLAHEWTKYEGCVTINNVPVTSIKARALSKIRAVLPQHTTVNFPFTIEQVIEIGRYPHLSTAEENNMILNEVMLRTNLMQFKGRTYSTLSGGERQRVQMARVMAQIWDEDDEPKYLLLDEPTSSLDMAQQHSLLALAKGLCERNIGVLAILHDLNLAAQYADKVLFVKNGCIVAQGPTIETITEPIIENTFGHPARVIIDDEHGYPIIYPIRKGPKRKLFDKPINAKYIYEQHH